MSLLLVFSLLSMMLPHTVMAMSMSGSPQQMSMQHNAGRVMHAISLDHVRHHSNRHGQCHCAAHCGLCGVCHSMLLSTALSGVSGVCAAPDGPRPASFAVIYLSPDIHPPRA